LPASLELGDEVVLVGHGWGVNLAVDWAMKIVAG
jgi:predicted alpha/beta hydrolase family esterase